MDASDVTARRPDLPAPDASAARGETIDLTTGSIEPPPKAPRRRHRTVLMIVLAAWALVMVGEIGYVIGRDRTTNPSPLGGEAAAGDLTVLQAVVQSQQDRLVALQSHASDAATTLSKSQQALAQSQQDLVEAQTKPTAPAVVQIPLKSFDPLGGAPLRVYAGTLALAACDGFGDPSACSPENHLAFTLGRAADGSLTLSSALFVNAPVSRDGGVLHAQGPVVNATYAVACNGETTATFFDAQLVADQLTVVNGQTEVATYATTFTITAPPGGSCPQRAQFVYVGSLVKS
jgi:hypothetical protein